MEESGAKRLHRIRGVRDHQHMRGQGKYVGVLRPQHAVGDHAEGTVGVEAFALGIGSSGMNVHDLHAARRQHRGETHERYDLP